MLNEQKYVKIARKPEISWQNEIIEYIKEIYRLTCHVQSSSASGA